MFGIVRAMKGSTQFYIWLGVLVLITAFEYIWLWFIITRPEKWAVWVDRENDFWVRKGIISAPFAERMKRREKGLPQKLLVGTGAFLGTGCLVFGYLLFKHGLP
jgi:hypothetical protein